MSEIFKNILFPHRLPRKILQDAGIICKSCILSMPHIPQPIVPLKYLMPVMFLDICNLSTFNDSNFLHDNEIPNNEKYNKRMEEIGVAHVRDFACLRIACSCSLLWLFLAPTLWTLVTSCIQWCCSCLSNKAGHHFSLFINFLELFCPSKRQPSARKQNFYHNCESIFVNCIYSHK